MGPTGQRLWAPRPRTRASRADPPSAGRRGAEAALESLQSCGPDRRRNRPVDSRPPRHPLPFTSASTFVGKKSTPSSIAAVSLWGLINPPINPRCEKIRQKFPKLRGQFHFNDVLRSGRHWRTGGRVWGGGPAWVWIMAGGWAARRVYKPEREEVKGGGDSVHVRIGRRWSGFALLSASICCRDRFIDPYS